MIELCAVTKQLGEKRILDSFSYTFAEGKTTCLLGPTGCGKTTLLRIASGLIKPDRGTVQGMEGVSSFVFQEDRLLPWFSVLENLTCIGIPEENAVRWLKAMGLQGEMGSSVETLSGGMQRRVCLARAMAVEGKKYFLDEPLRGLDAETMRHIMDTIRQALQGRTALLVTHNPEEAFSLADHFLAVDGLPLRVAREAGRGQMQTIEAFKRWLYATETDI